MGFGRIGKKSLVGKDGILLYGEGDLEIRVSLQAVKNLTRGLGDRIERFTRERTTKRETRERGRERLRYTVIF